MRSLSAHLRQSEAHAVLPFHPDCPICRHTRVLGDVRVAGVVSPRVQAAMVAGMLVVATAAPAAPALATEPDQEQDGTAPVTQDSTGDPALNPDFDPGGDSANLPDDAPPLPETVAPPDPGNDDTAPVEADPTTNPTEPVVDAGDGADQPTAPPASAEPTPAPSASTEATEPPDAAPTPPAAPAPAPTVPTPAPTAVAAPDAPPATSVPATQGKPTPRSRTAPATKDHRTPRDRTRPAPEPSASRPAQRDTADHTLAASSEPTRLAASGGSPVAAPVVYSTPKAQLDTPSATPATRHPAKPGDRSHIVEPGESLWAIAADLLGDATPARVAREVHRLWTLNRDRIGTGNPDLLRVGTRLVLR